MLLLKKVLSGLLVLPFLIAFAEGQQVVEPPPDNVKVASQPESPLRLRIEQSRRGANMGRAMSYAVRNQGAKGIIGFVVSGLPGATQKTVVLETPLRPDVERHFPIMLERNAPIQGEFLAKVDFVLFDDAGKWGKSGTEDADFVVGFFDGLRQVLATAKQKVAAKNEPELIAFINSAPAAPEPSTTERSAKNREGFNRGYASAIYSFRDSLRSRGDTRGLPARISSLERAFGSRASAAGLKVISTNPGLIESPVKILTVALGKAPVSLDEGFASKPDWLKDLTFRLRNNSGRTVTRATISLSFPETAAIGNNMQYTISYGPPWLPMPGTNQNEVPIPDKAEFEMRIDELELFRLKKFFGDRISLDELTHMVFQIESIGFDDDTMWRLGTMMRKDAENPRRWVPISK